MATLKKIANKLKYCLINFIPDTYRQDSQILFSIYKYLAIGLAIRLVLMPLTASTDLLWINWRAHLIVYHKQFFLGASQMLNNYLHAVFMWFFSPFMPYHEQIWPHSIKTTHPQTPEQLSQVINIFYDFVRHPHIFRTLFLVKLPYLLIELGCLSLILRIFNQPQKGLTALKFWIFNPIIIFVVYIYGRFEIISAVFILASLFMIKKQRPFWANFLLGLGIAARWYPALLLPFYLIASTSKKIEKLYQFILAILPVALMSFLSQIAGQSGEIALAAKASHLDYLLSMNFALGLHDSVYLFVTGYVLLCLYLIYQKYICPAQANTALLCQQSPLGNIIRFGSAGFLLLFATCYFHLQFFMWPMALLTLYVPEEKRLVKLLGLACLCWWIYTWQWGRINTTYLLLPICPEAIINWSSPAELIERIYPAHKFIGIFRSIFSAILIAMIFLTLKPVTGAAEED